MSFNLGQIYSDKTLSLGILVGLRSSFNICTATPNR